MRNIFFLLIFCCGLMSYSQVNPLDYSSYEEVANYTEISLNDNTLKWGYLTVPEDWEKDTKNEVKLATVVIKSHESKSKEGVVFLQGGPGGGAVGGIGMWLNHPLRATKDIILIDLRGTGFSKPELCPDLGKVFMQILAEDYDIEKEIKERVIAVMECRVDLLKRNIDIYSYNSRSIAKDLHALKVELGYKKWTVYGASYGTRVAYDYVTEFSEDIDKLILDSPIPLRGYYDTNTSSFFKSLNILFDKCNLDYKCKNEYGDLKRLFYETLSEIEREPISVNVPFNIHPSGKFVLNAQDFLMAIQQSLYDGVLFEVLPLMIKEFRNRNKEMISTLVSSLGSRLSLDYGTYYSMSCYEILPYNNLESFIKDANLYDGLLSKGLSFYRGDYFICDEWLDLPSEINEDDNLAIKLSSVEEIPTLILSGEFDPITPSSNGKVMNEVIPNSQLVNFKGQGHVPGFSGKGWEVIASFSDNSVGLFVDEIKLGNKQRFATDIIVNSGIYKFAKAMLNRDLKILVPMLLSALCLIITIVVVPILWMRHRKKMTFYEKTFYVALFLGSSLGLIYLFGLTKGINETVTDNFYILVFGLPNTYLYILVIPYIIISLIVGTVFYLLKTKEYKTKRFFVVTYFGLLGLLLEVFFLNLFQI